VALLVPKEPRGLKKPVAAAAPKGRCVVHSTKSTAMSKRTPQQELRLEPFRHCSPFCLGISMLLAVLGLSILAGIPFSVLLGT
jgi:hypothetical protein